MTSNAIDQSAMQRLTGDGDGIGDTDGDGNGLPDPRQLNSRLSHRSEQPPPGQSNPGQSNRFGSQNQSDVYQYMAKTLFLVWGGAWCGDIWHFRELPRDKYSPLNPVASQLLSSLLLKASYT